MKIIFLSFAILLFITGCASTSTYRGGIGSYQDYDGFQDYLNRYTPTDSNNSEYYYDDNTYSTNSGNTSSGGSSSSQSNLQKTITPPPENIKLGAARDGEAVQRATMKPYQINGKWYYPQQVSIGETYDGIASWYGPDFHNKKTSNGETYDMHLHTAAHKTLPMNTLVKVVSKDTNKSTIVRINDRGPFVEGRIIDLSAAAAKDIDMVKSGTARVNIEVIGFGGVVSNEIASSSTLVKDMVNSNEFKNEFKTGNVEKTFDGGNFAIQIGAFRKKAGAEIYRDSHKYNNYSTIIKDGDLNNEPIYRVFVTGFKSEAEARDFLKDNKIDGFFIRD
ncbi:septal ring lytic transglycosylase RlpA family protein [Helicobacter sp. 16-1353]|uniref:septal ring lytic transglycosylase RlpA family protein n=1 Tax=Helicobacter sp. 16-1353 TaxID=2004996 RepID=UPI0023EE9A31|nr:septal ring lytic transglycosylase RlpA family protein [Helicobacter sp. 16-1353]